MELSPFASSFCGFVSGYRRCPASLSICPSRLEEAPSGTIQLVALWIECDATNSCRESSLHWTKWRERLGLGTWSKEWPWSRDIIWFGNGSSSETSTSPWMGWRNGSSNGWAWQSGLPNAWRPGGQKGNGKSPCCSRCWVVVVVFVDLSSEQDPLLFGQFLGDQYSG